MDNQWLKKFATYDGKKLRAETLAEELVGPDGLRIIELFDREPSETELLFETNIEDEELPATHDCTTSFEGGRVTSIEYRLHYHMEGESGGMLEKFKKHGTDAFSQLTKALTAKYGKPSVSKPKRKEWTVDGRELVLHVTNHQNDRPCTSITLNVAASS
jgi:hypothetical protein